MSVLPWHYTCRVWSGDETQERAGKQELEISVLVDSNSSPGQKLLHCSGTCTMNCLIERRIIKVGKDLYRSSAGAAQQCGVSQTPLTMAPHGCPLSCHQLCEGNHHQAMRNLGEATDLKGTARSPHFHLFPAFTWNNLWFPSLPPTS